VGDEIEGLALARGQGRQTLRGHGVDDGTPREEGLDHAARHLGCEQGLTSMDGLDAGDEQLRLDVLDEEPAGPAAQGLVHVVIHVEGRQHDDAGLVVTQRHHPAGGLDAVEIRHPHVHQDDVRPKGARQLDGFGAVAGLSDDLEVRLDLQEEPETLRSPNGHSAGGQRIPPSWIHHPLPRSAHHVHSAGRSWTRSRGGSSLGAYPLAR
jgi:hypothetical protein